MRRWLSSSAERGAQLRRATQFLCAAPDSRGTVDLELDHVTETATITLRNEGHRNALTPHMMVQFGEAVERLETWDDGRVVVLRGAGGTFCAGADLSAARDYVQSSEDGMQMAIYMQAMTSRLRELPLVSLCQVDGYAVGGGTELSTACDFRIFAADATWRMVHVKMGVVPGWGGGHRIAKLLGRQHALRLLGTAAPVGASEALAIGLADAVALPSASAARRSDGGAVREAAAAAPSSARGGWGHIDVPIEAAVARLAAQFRDAGALSAVRGAKRVIAGAERSDSVVRALDGELEIFASTWGSAANVEALAK